MNKKTYQRQYKYSQAFCQLRSVNELCRLIQVDKRKLLLMTQQPKYKAFSIPKKGGGERHIETPSPTLKRIQSKINRYLQSVYYFEKSRAAFGFVIGVRNDEDRRNVVTNARKHLQQTYLLNVDLKDFFHSVKRKQVQSMFEQEPFNFKHDLPGILTKLTTYKGRLPMGSPTSPALSNLASRELDDKLMELSESHNWVFTRYADDLSFSAKQIITYEQVEAVKSVIKASPFTINEKKTKLFGPDDDKIVTGLLLKEKVELASDYLESLEKDINQLKSVMEVQNFQGEISSKWVEQFKLLIRGRLNFAGFVLGKRNPEYIRLKDAYYTAINPPQDEFGAFNWRSFPYNF